MTETGRILLEPAYLLHRTSYRETSLFLEFLTREHGRVSVLGKGLRRKKGAASAVFFPFAPLRVSWSARGELPILTDVEVVAAQPLADARALACGLYLNELILRLLAPHDPHPPIFEVYGQALHRLAAGDEREAVLRNFEVLLLAELGYELPLECDIATGDGLDPGRYYRYIVEQGPVAALPDAGAVRGSALIALRTGVFSNADDLKDAKRLMRGVIAHHLGGRSLKSRELFKYSRT